MREGNEVCKSDGNAAAWTAPLKHRQRGGDLSSPAVDQKALHVAQRTDEFLSADGECAFSPIGVGRERIEHRLDECARYPCR
ncbi:hypothetical protein JHV666_41340 [Mycobacterium avium subsp. hominissuis]